jgi:hypothetical protein
MPRRLSVNAGRAMPSSIPFASEVEANSVFTGHYWRIGRRSSCCACKLAAGLQAVNVGDDDFAVDGCGVASHRFAFDRLSAGANIQSFWSVITLRVISTA